MIKLNENITICDLIEQYATEIPDKTAVLFENQKISFRELNDKAAIFSNYLRTEIIKDQLSPLIALYLDRSISTLIAILGVLKAGAAYIPIDPAYPEARVKFILNDTQTKTLISQTHLIEKVAEFSSEYQQIKHIINIDNIAQQTLPNNIINVPLCQTDLAYIIYTSGTTGQPKGVMVDHKGLLEFVYKNNFIDYSLINIVAGASNYAFDGSCFDFFFTLANGFTLTLLDQNTLFDIYCINLKAGLDYVELSQNYH
jgi:non-ribosomal peptide synthetase component F